MADNITIQQTAQQQNQQAPAIQKIASDAVNNDEKKNAFGVSLIPFHSHTGVDSSRINGEDLQLSDLSTNDVTISKHGLAPKAPNDTAKFLRGDATWNKVKGEDLTLTTSTANDVSIVEHGFAPKAPNDTTKFLRGDATYAVPAYPSSPQATFTAGENLIAGSVCYIRGVVETTANPSQDCYIDIANPDVNYNNDDLKVYSSTTNPQMRSFVKFDVSSLPSNAIKAYIRFAVSIDGSQYAMKIFNVTSAWVESGPTWNTQPTFDLTTEYDRANCISQGVTGWTVDFDITTLYNAWKSGSITNNGIVLHETPVLGLDLQMAFYSRSGATPPILSVVATDSTVGQAFKADSGTLYKTAGELWVASATISSGSSGTFFGEGSLSVISGLTDGRTYFLSTAGSVSLTAGTYIRILGKAGSGGSQMLFHPLPVVVRLKAPTDMWTNKSNVAIGILRRREYIHLGFRPRSLKMTYLNSGVSPTSIVDQTYDESFSSDNLIIYQNTATTLSVTTAGSDPYSITVTPYDYGIEVKYEDTDGAGTYTYKFTKLYVLAYQ